MLNNKKVNYSLILIILLTLFLRLFWLNHTILEGDMFRDLTIADNIIKGNIRLVGITAGIEETSTQQSFGPIMYYILAFLMLISKNLLFIVGFVALLNSLAVLLTYYFCRKYFDEKTAIIASLLYAINPWAIYMSDIFWNPNFLPIFSILLFYFLFKLIINENNWAFPITSFLIAIMLNFHLTPLFYLPILILSILLFRRDIKLKYYFYSLITFLLPFIPFIYFNLKHGYSLLGPVLYGSVRESSTFFTSLIESIGIPIMLATNYLGKYVYGESFIFYNKIMYYLVLFITAITVLLFGLGLLYLILQIRKDIILKNNTKVKYYLILFIIIIPMLLQFIRFSNISPHYYFMLYPIQFVLLGLIIKKLIEYKNLKKITYFILVLIILINLFTIYALHDYIEKNGSTKYGEFSISYKNKQEVINFIVNDSKEQPIKILFYGRSYKSFKYLFDNQNIKIDYKTIDNSDNIKNFNGYYLILDKVSYHRVILNKEQEDFFNNLKIHYIIRSVDLYKIKE